MKNVILHEPDSSAEHLAHEVIGAAIEVHRHLGPGYLENIYEEALALELQHKNMVFQRQYPIYVSYKGKSVGEGRIDLLIENTLIVELKTVDNFSPIHTAQVISYLKSLDLTLGLLLNFKTATLRDGIKRVVYTNR